ncbi:OTU-domain-containing protein [Gigaspora margarita]|uniref:Ubiquitin thioesterase OTU n=1 Tax=Gigaspora margarita TaxID=4874 RepID=A0A8H4AFD3_GIGMA|nr:OTU-domain-containing protein [Gigaspora margarita]
MRLRVRSKDKVHMINDLTPTSTLFELKSAIHALSGISPLRQELKIGYPPRVCGAKDDETLSSAGIQNGDQIILDENALPETTSQPASQPASQPVNKVTGSLETESISVPVESGFIILREMEDDNSCLFRAIGYGNLGCLSLILRNTIIKYIKDDPETYSDVVLGKSRDDYCSWIAEKNSWGGAIVLFKSGPRLNLIHLFLKYRTCDFCILLQKIRSVDVKSGRIDRYGHGIYDKCVYVIYSGIHYDAVALTPMIGADQEYDQTVFDTTDESILSAVIGIADKMKQLRKYTYTADFTIRCGQCQKGLKGEQEAVQHARETGHTSFTEYDG